MWKWILAGVTLAILAAVLVGLGMNGGTQNDSAAKKQPVSAPPRLAIKEEPVVVKPSVWVPPVEDYNRPQKRSEAEEKAEALAALNGLRTASGNDASSTPPRGGGGGGMSLLMSGGGKGNSYTYRGKDGSITTVTKGAPMEGWQREQIDRDNARQQLRDLGVHVDDTPGEKFFKDLERRGAPKL